MKQITFAIALSVGIGTAALSNIALAHTEHQHKPRLGEGRSAIQMSTAAAHFLDLLSAPQRASVIYDFISDVDRTRWSNAPVSSKARNGLPIGRLSLAQRHALHQLLIASTSAQGYQKIWGAVRADDVLKKEGENRELDSKKFFDKQQSLGAGNYWVSFYGDPAKDSRWGYMLTGHHLAANFSVVDGQTTFVPMFYGADPGVVEQGLHAGHVFLPFERRRGVELLQSLNPAQQKVAVVKEEYPANKYGAVDFTGPGKKDAQKEYRGIKASELDDAQLKLLWALIEEYVRNADFDVAEKQLEKINNDGLAALHFLWMGPTDGSGKIFFRVHSPSILIDFVDQRTEFDWNTHPHTIVRDPSNDYGENWLERHISESH